MDKEGFSFLENITNIIENQEYANSDEFYELFAKEINTYFKMPCCIYFLNEADFEKKASYPQNSFALSDKIIQEIKDNREKSFFIQIEKKYLLISKLLIKGSLLGFCAILSENKPDENIFSSLNFYTTIYSYLIKDFELNQVFKMQLTSLQKAISDKDEAYKIIARQNEKLLQTNGIKNNFLANVSHELKTPINAIIGFSQALSANIFGDLNQKQSEYIQDIQVSGLHLLNMINEILDFSKIETGAMQLNLQEFSPEIITKEVVAIMTPLSEKKNIKVFFKNAYEGKIFADMQKYQQILYNLLSNAIKFTPENGKIVITTKQEGNKFVLEVQDNGIGIASKYHNKIFTKFVHINDNNVPKEGSTGLGLAITKELVHLHGGKIILKSALHKGSTFRIELDCLRR